MFSAMEASNCSVMYLNPLLNRPGFLKHSSDPVMLDINSGAKHASICSLKRHNTRPRASFRPSSHGLNSRPNSSTPCHVTREDQDSGGPESILLNEQTLERELQQAIDQENYAQAAKIRDTLRLLQDDSKASVLAANAKFYNSFRNGDLASMRALWSTGRHSCVVHPGVSGISGYDLVMGSWEFVWADYEFPLDIETKDVEVHVRGDMGYVTCIEMVRNKGSGWGRHFAMNVFERVDDQWFMCVHHASYIDL